MWAFRARKEERREKAGGALLNAGGDEEEAGEEGEEEKEEGFKEADRWLQTEEEGDCDARCNGVGAVIMAEAESGERGAFSVAAVVGAVAVVNVLDRSAAEEKEGET